MKKLIIYGGLLFAAWAVFANDEPTVVIVDEPDPRKGPKNPAADVPGEVTNPPAGNPNESNLRNNINRVV